MCLAKAITPAGPFISERCRGHDWEAFILGFQGARSISYIERSKITVLLGI